MLRRLLYSLRELLYPGSCCVCNRPSESQLCEECRAKITIRSAEAHCAICGKVLVTVDGAVGTAIPICGECAAEHPPFELARSAVEYSGPIRVLIHALKYKNQPWLARMLADFPEGAVHAFFQNYEIDVIVPVPMHWFKQYFERGYNQSELIAKELSKRLRIPCDPSLLKRVVYKETQTQMNREERIKNAENVFAVPPSKIPYIYGRTILVIDDVMTSGATLRSCASALRAAGAARILCLSVARD